MEMAGTRGKPLLGRLAAGMLRPGGKAGTTIWEPSTLVWWVLLKDLKEAEQAEGLMRFLLSKGDRLWRLYCGTSQN